MNPERRNFIEAFFNDRENLMRKFVMSPAIVLAQVDNIVLKLLDEIDELEAELARLKAGEEA